MADTSTSATSGASGTPGARGPAGDSAPEAPGRGDARRRLVWWIVGIVGCTIGAALAIWLALANTLGQVTWRDTAYRVVDNTSVWVAFDVHRPSGTAVTCTVQALDERFGTVGTVQVDLPAGPSTDVHREVTIRTTTRAVTGTVKVCTPA